MVLRTVSERGIVKGIADACGERGVVPDLSLFEAHICFLFAELCGFELEALFFRLLEACA